MATAQQSPALAIPVMFCSLFFVPLVAVSATRRPGDAGMRAGVGNRRYRLKATGIAPAPVSNGYLLLHIFPNEPDSRANVAPPMGAGYFHQLLQVVGVEPFGRSPIAGHTFHGLGGTPVLQVAS